MEGSTPGFSQLGLEGGSSFSGVLPDALDVLWRPAKNFDRFRCRRRCGRLLRHALAFSFGEVAIGWPLSDVHLNIDWLGKGRDKNEVKVRKTA
jgi:hypothetical protein